jgi:hypothetical protein
MEDNANERGGFSSLGGCEMKRVLYLFAAAAISGLALATPSSASPLASGLSTGTSSVPQADETLVQKVHGWHCRRRSGHRHRRACYDDDYGYGYYGSYGYPYGGFGFGFPFLGFSFYDNDNHHSWRRHGHHGKWRGHGGHRKWKRHGGHRKWKRKHW